MISFGALFIENAAPYFSRNDARMFSKYKQQAAHHDLIRWIVLLPQSSVSPEMALSTVAALCLLYGAIISGSSWWIARHSLQRKRRMTNMTVSVSFSTTFRIRLPMTISTSPHIGHTLTSMLTMYIFLPALFFQ